jgi:pre-rRNA-processing protein TSR2
MAASKSGGGPISPQAAAALGEGIKLVFGRWTALQMAVENQWGGRESRAKADQFGESIYSWFCNFKGTAPLAPSDSLLPSRRVQVV